MEVFPGALQTEQKVVYWREALEDEMNLKDSEGHHRITGPKLFVGSSSAPYCNRKYPRLIVVIDARTQQVLIVYLYSLSKSVRLARMSERSYDMLTKIIQAVAEISEGKLQEVLGQNFMKLIKGRVSEIQKKKASGALPTQFPTKDEKDRMH